jgi:tRNA-dihydrouridine synthase
MLERAGCALIAIHARPVFPPGVAHRAQRCEADLNVVRELASSLSIPVLSNGSTETEADVSHNLRLTGAAGVMSAEASLTPHLSPTSFLQGILRNPRLFEKGRDGATELAREELGRVALEYLELAEAYPPEDVSWARSHLTWLLGKAGKGHRCTFEHCGPYSSQQLRLALMGAESLAELRGLVRCTLLE